jgi:hypothetical protein
VKTGVLQVNCFDWEDVCAKENITLYPTVRFYRYSPCQSSFLVAGGLGRVFQTICLVSPSCYTSPCNMLYNLGK